MGGVSHAHNHALRKASYMQASDPPSGIWTDLWPPRAIATYGSHWGALWWHNCGDEKEGEDAVREKSRF